MAIRIPKKRVATTHLVSYTRRVFASVIHQSKVESTLFLRTLIAVTNGPIDLKFACDLFLE
jgi:hypothetical protein